MEIGVAKEGRGERRVALTPAAVRLLVADGHRVCVESGAGRAAGWPDEAYAAQGAIVGPKEVVWRCPILCKVAAPTREETLRLTESQILISYLHLPGSFKRTMALCGRGVTAIALELCETPDGARPLLAPSSHLAGIAAVRAVCQRLTKSECRDLPGPGMAGKLPRRVLVVGGGAAGECAAWLAQSLGSAVSVLEMHPGRRQHLASRGLVAIGPEAEQEWEAQLQDTDGVIWATMTSGAPPPRQLGQALTSQLQDGTVVVDLTVAEGGAVDPRHLRSSITYLGVPNWPSDAAETASMNLSRALVGFVRRLAGWGLATFLERHPWAQSGVALQAGAICHPALASLWGRTA